MTQKGEIILCRCEFGKFKNPKNDECEIVEKFTWKTKNRMEISVMTFGASLIEIKIPNRDGVMEDILMGYDNFEDYARDGKFLFGSVCGPLCGIIKNAEYCLNGRYHKLPRNFNKDHCINCGNSGFHRQNWIPYVDGTNVILSYTTDGNNGFPAIILIQILFSVSSNNEILIKTTARSNKVTPVDMGIQLYFNLASHKAGEDQLMEHLIKIDSSKFYQKLENGFFDKCPKQLCNFNKNNLHNLKEIIDENESFDCFYEIEKSEEKLPMILRAIHVLSGRTIEIYSNQPAIEINTCTQFPKNELQQKSSTEHLTLEYLKSKLTEKEIEFFKCCVDTDKINVKKQKCSKDECLSIEIDEELKGPIIGKENAEYCKNYGLSILCHNFPNAVKHQKKFPEILLKPGAVYENVLMLKFKVHVEKSSKLK
ncbi:hypothetical protein PVAND_005900 [Polypedilum vanderplanki]|uniref:Galactose mutarotase n=1 Tax=Polypedilum vanderplanki TaxID=319348 RepID=A0A9J6C3E8_POLVA|nr:hypothetical protein PVAND_005900 [Polypedilum vanderplanki]